jgi:putative oxidoreductase
VLIRRIARPLLAGVFVTGGIDVLRNPGPRAEKAEPLTSKLGNVLPLPQETEQVVRLNAIAQVTAGALLAAGRLPRLAATVLAGSLVPTTLAGHPFWEEDDPRTRAQQRIHLAKNLAILGGLLLAAVDTEGSPSLGWRARQAAKRARKRVSD